VQLAADRWHRDVDDQDVGDAHELPDQQHRKHDPVPLRLFRTGQRLSRLYRHVSSLSSLCRPDDERRAAGRDRSGLADAAFEEAALGLGAG
jgi:hypothetical protein